MPGGKHTDQKKATLLEIVLRVQGDFRQRLAPFRVTPLQAGVMLYLHRHREAQMTELFTLRCHDRPTVN